MVQPSSKLSDEKNTVLDQIKNKVSLHPPHKQHRCSARLYPKYKHAWFADFQLETGCCKETKCDGWSKNELTSGGHSREGQRDSPG